MTTTGTLILPLELSNITQAGKRFVPYCNVCGVANLNGVSAMTSLGDARRVQDAHRRLKHGES